MVGAGDFVEDGGDHLAGTAPLRPVVHQHRGAGLQHFGFEGGVGEMFDEGASHGGFLGFVG
ncbi:hypothetical protein D3C78_1891880 [compost metagenome]